MGGTGKVLNTIGFCELFEFLGAVLWPVVGNQLRWDAMFCKDALKMSHYCLRGHASELCDIRKLAVLV